MRSGTRPTPSPASSRSRRYFASWQRPWNYATDTDTADRLGRAGFDQIESWLEPRPVTPEEHGPFAQTVCLVRHLDPLPPSCGSRSSTESSSGRGARWCWTTCASHDGAAAYLTRAPAGSRRSCWLAAVPGGTRSSGSGSAGRRRRSRAGGSRRVKTYAVAVDPLVRLARDNELVGGYAIERRGVAVTWPESTRCLSVAAGSLGALLLGVPAPSCPQLDHAVSVGRVRLLPQLEQLGRRPPASDHRPLVDDRSRRADRAAETW